MHARVAESGRDDGRIPLCLFEAQFEVRGDILWGMAASDWVQSFATFP